MEFGIFSQMHVPPWDDEHSRYLRELEVSLAVEAAGFKYDWSPEHHFLKNYSHQPAPEVYPTTPPPLWVACSSPPTFIEAGELGLGSLCFTFGTPAEIAEHVRNYKAAIKRCKQPVGEYINDNIAVTTNMFCLEDGDQARHLYSKARVEAFTEFFFGWLDSIPRPKGFPPTGPIKVPPSTPEDLKAGLAMGGRQIGSPEEIVRVIQMYEALGVDQLIYAPLTLTLDQKYVLESIETFGKHVLPKFDTDPMHRTTRQREAALKARAA